MTAKTLQHLLIVLALVTSCVSPATARLVPNPTVAELAALADLIVVGEIATAKELIFEQKPCGTKYVLKVREIVKGGIREAVQSELTVGRLEGLIVGSSYLLFLQHISSPQTYSDRHLGERIPLNDRDASFLECKGMIPGLFYLPHGAWPIDSESVTISRGVYPVDVPVNRGKRNLDIRFATEKGPLIDYIRSLAK